MVKVTHLFRVWVRVRVRVRVGLGLGLGLGPGPGSRPELRHACLASSSRTEPMLERREERQRELGSDADDREGGEWALLGEPLGELPPCTLARRSRERPCHVACQAASADSLSKRKVSSCRRPVPQLEASQPEPSPSVRSGGGAGEAALRTALA